MSTGAFAIGELERQEKRRFAADKWQENARDRAAFERVRRAEVQFGMHLRKIARAIGDIVRMFDPAEPGHTEQLIATLNEYSMLIMPWARAVSRRMLAEVSRRDEDAWRRYSRLMGVEIRRELTETDIGHLYHQLMDEQVALITSLPRDAAQRVHALVTGNLYKGARAGEVQAEIMRTGEVMKSRAMLIARTETGRAASAFTRARAQSIGSPGYVWRTSKDRRVRPRHRHLEGTFQRWDDPPVIGENGERGAPGEIYQCRCYPEVVLPE